MVSPFADFGKFTKGGNRKGEKMKKLLIALLTVCFALSAGFTVAQAAKTPEPERVNVTKGLSDEAVKVTDSEGNEASLIGGPHGGSGDKSIFTDGVISSTATATVAVGGKGVIGYITLDAGAEYVTDRVLIDMCHDWGGQNLVVELSLTEDFANPVTIFDNRAGHEYSADSTVGVTSVLYNRANRGITFNFSPVKARYIRVTDNTVGNGKAQGYTTFGEIQMYAVTNVSYVYSDTTGGVENGVAKLYATEENAEIYYTVDGSVPDKDSHKYNGGIEVDGTAKVRAVAYKNGVYGCPVDFVFTGKKQFISRNAALGKTAKAYHVDGTEAAVSDHNGGKTIECVTDGIMGAENSITTDSVAFVQVDMGESVWINKVILNLWHDHVWRSVTVQLSDDETFATGVQTIFCSDYGNWAKLAAYVGTLDETWADRVNTEWIAGHNAANGFEFNFAPIKGRYIRALAQDGSSPYSSVYTELQAWTCEEPGKTEYEYKNYLSSVEEPEAIEVYEGKEQSDLGLPQIVRLVYSDGSEQSVTAVWNVEGYDKTKAGEYYAKLNVTDDKDVYGLIAKVSVKITVKSLNINEIVELYEFAKDVDGNDYTLSTRTKFIEARETVKNLLAQSYKTQSEVDNAKSALEKAVRALVNKGDVTALNRLIDGLNVGEESNYTISSYKVYAEKLAAAEAAAEGGNDDLDQKAVDEIAARLEKAVSELETRANVTELKALYEKNKTEKGYGEQSTNGYTRATYAAYMDAMYNAEKFFDEEYIKDVNQGAADDAKEKLVSAVNGLIPIPDKTALDEITAKIKKAERSEYTSTSFKALEEVYAKVKAIAEKTADLLTEAEIKEATDKLTASYNALVKLGDKKALNEAIGNSAGEESKDYTKASYAKYAEAMYNAERCKESDDVSQSDVDKAAGALNEAYDGLEKLGDRTLLNELIEKAKSLAGLEGTRKENVDKALAYAESIVAFEGEVTEKQVSEAKELLEKAMAENIVSGGCSGSVGFGLGLSGLISGLAACVIISKKRVKDENV